MKDFRICIIITGIALVQGVHSPVPAQSNETPIGRLVQQSTSTPEPGADESGQAQSKTAAIQSAINALSADLKNMIKQVEFVKKDKLTSADNNAKSASPSSMNDVPLRTGAQTYNMQAGSMLILHNTPASLNTINGTADITRGTAAFVVQVGRDVAVYNLSGTQSHSVDVTVGSQVFSVPIGKAIILTQSSGNLTECPLSQCIELENGTRLGADGSVNIFTADFSYVSTLDNCPQFQQFVRSSDPSERKIAKELLRMAAASQ